MSSRSQRIWFAILLSIFVISRLVLMVYTPLMDPSEARYAVFAKNMVQSEDWWCPTYNYEGVDTVFVGKPPLAFQMSMACCKILGVSEFATRLPAFFASMLILWLVWHYVKKWRDENTAMIATLLTCCSFLFFMYAGQTMTDQILTATIVGAIFSYVGFERSCEKLSCELRVASCKNVLPHGSTNDSMQNNTEDHFAKSRNSQLATHYSLLFFVWIALGILVKGPVALVMSGLPVFFYVLINNRWKNLKYHAWVFGPILFLAIVIPYYWIVSVKHPDFLQYFIIEENFNRFLFKGSASRFGTARESFRGVSILFFLALNLPVVFLLQLYPAINRKKMYCGNVLSDPLSGIAAMTCLSLVFFWALTSRVLITYLLPTIPFFAVFLAVRFCDGGLLEQMGFKKAIHGFLTVWLVLLPMLFSGAVYAGIYYSSEQASPIVAQAVEEINKYPKYSNRQYYFSYLSPHIAEFYYKDKTQFHVPESFETSIQNSQQDWLFMTDKQIREYGKPIPRTLVFHKGKWNLFAPVDMKTNINPTKSVPTDSTINPHK